MYNINYAKFVGCVESFFMCVWIIKNTCTGVSKQGSNCWGSVSYFSTPWMIHNSFFGHANQFATNKLTCNSYFTLPVADTYFEIFWNPRMDASYNSSFLFFSFLVFVCVILKAHHGKGKDTCISTCTCIHVY